MTTNSRRNLKSLVGNDSHRRACYTAQRAVLVAVAIATLSHAGCMQRRMLVRSYPEGALITVDHQPIGHTPVAVPFTYYGTREIRAEMDGYEPQKVKHRLAPPWYQIPPLDLITDNFWPREINDDRVIDFRLTPASLVDENDLIDRASQLRGDVGRGTVPMPLARETAQPAIDAPPASTANLPSVLDRFR